MAGEKILTPYGYQFSRYVYVITNKTNGKRYVGSAHNPEARFRSHLSRLRHGRHSVPLMQKDFDEVGADGFEWTTIAMVTGRGSQNEEYKWMRTFKTYDERFGYNYQDFVMLPDRKTARLPIKERVSNG